MQKDPDSYDHLHLKMIQKTSLVRIKQVFKHFSSTTEIKVMDIPYTANKTKIKGNYK